MPELDFTIRTTAELAGAEATARSLEMQIGKAKALGQDYSDLSTQLERVKGSLAGVQAELVKTPPPAAEGGLKDLSLRGHELRAVFDELSGFVPGLGAAIRNLGGVSTEVATQVAAGEAELSTATESMIASAGPLVVVVLAIQAAAEYWDRYKESVKSAAEAQAQALDKIRSSTKAALDEQTQFVRVLAAASQPEDTHPDAPGRVNPVIDAQTESNRKSLDLQILDDQTKITRYGGEVATQTAVHEINDDERLRASDRTISKGAEGMDAVAHGERLSQEQIKANEALTELFAAHIGGLQAMQQIIKYNLEHTKTQAEEIQVIKNALNTLQNSTARAAAAADLH